MAEKYMYVKLIKEWGGYQVGDIVRFGWNKGEGRVTAGEGVQVPKQRAVNDPPEPPKPEPPKIELPEVETATAEPEAEKAVVEPVKKKTKSTKKKGGD